MIVQCFNYVNCGNMVDPSKEGTFREVFGWEEVRSGGGAHSITLRTETGRLACPSCMQTKRATKFWPGEIGTLL